MEQADILLVEVAAMSEELLKRVWREAAVLGVVGALAVIIFVRDPMCVKCFPSLRVRQQFISLLYFDKFCFCFRMIRFVGMPKRREYENQDTRVYPLIDNFFSQNFIKFSSTNHSFASCL